MAAHSSLSNPEVERTLLGAILVNGATLFETVQGRLRSADFSIGKHSQIFTAIEAVYRRGDSIDRITVADALNTSNHLEGIGGLSYLVSLDDALPRMYSVDSYVAILREKSAQRRLIATAQKAIEQITLEATPSEVAIADLRAALDTAETSVVTTTSTNVEEFLQTFKGGINELLAPAPRKRGWPTGYQKLDEILGGIRPGCLYVLAGDVSRGKSAMAMNIALNVAGGGVPTEIYSLEMSREEVLRRMACHNGEVNIMALLRGELDTPQRYKLTAAISHIASLPLYISDQGDISIESFQHQVAVGVRKKGISVAVLDYTQLLNWSQPVDGRRLRDEREALAHITRSLKLFARKMDIAVIAVSQLHRERGRRPSKDGRPKLSDLHGSSTFEKDADVVLFVHRPEFDKPDDQSLKGKAEWIVAKHRNGPLGAVAMRFIGAFTKFVEADSPFDV